MIGHLVRGAALDRCCYLLYLGVTQWRAAVVDLTKTRPERKSAAGDLYPGLAGLDDHRSAAVLLGLLPQFVSPGRSVAPQVALLSVTFVVLAILVDGTWALVRSRAAPAGRRGACAIDFRGGC